MSSDSTSNVAESDRRLLACAFAGLFLLRLPLVWGRHWPIVFGDEYNYLWKARNLFEFKSYFTSSLAVDAPSHAAPLYSLFLTPAFFDGDPANVYRIALILNSLILAALVYPAYRVASSLFPAHRFICAAAAVTSIAPIAYSLTAMSEALFQVLLFATLAGYCRYHAQPTVANAWRLGALVGVLPLVRFQGLGVVAVFVLVATIERRGGLLRLTKPQTLVGRTPLFLPGLLLFGLWNWYVRAFQYSDATNVTHPPISPLRYLVRVEGTGLGFFSGIEALAHKILAQLAYLNLATANLLIVALVVVVAAGRSRRDRPTASAGSLMSPEMVLALTVTSCVLTSAVYMLGSSRRIDHPPRYDMFGRYVDTVVPILMLWAVGVLLTRSSRRLRPIVMVSVVLALGVLYSSIPSTIEAPHILNIGALWYLALGFGKTPAASVGVAIGSVCAFLVLRQQGRSARKKTVLALALTCSLAVTISLVEEIGLNQRRVVSEAIGLSGAEQASGRIFDAGQNSSRISYLVRFVAGRSPEPLPPGKHLALSAGQDLILYRDRLEKPSEFDLRTRTVIFDLLELADRAVAIGQGEANNPWNQKIVPFATPGGLLMLPPATVTYTLELPEGAPLKFRARTEFHPRARDWGSDGVFVRVRATSGSDGVESSEILVEPSQSRIIELDLSPMQGRTASVSLVVRNTREMNAVGDWLLWSEPVVVSGGRAGSSQASSSSDFGVAVSK